MKRSFKMIVMMLALTFGALIFNGASSQAAVSITNVKQTKQQLCGVTVGCCDLW